MLKEVKPNTWYIHTNTQNKYIVKEIGLYQNKKGLWLKCVIYYSYSHELTIPFVRKLKHFKKQFKLAKIQS